MSKVVQIIINSKLMLLVAGLRLRATPEIKGWGSDTDGDQRGS